MKTPIYIEVVIPVINDEQAEIIEAFLAPIGFESFLMEEKFLQAYIQKSFWDEASLKEVLISLDISTYTIKEIEPENWNAIWESNFQPIEVMDIVRVRAPFHAVNTNFPIEIIIEPKMSFGTGHHATTWQVMKLMLGISFKDKKVLDFGCGTGILAILALKLGANSVIAIDNDPQCIENAFENFDKNDSAQIQLYEADIKGTGNINFDIIIGNITRNTILEFLSDISLKTNIGGFFIASGFYLADLGLIKVQADLLNLNFIRNLEKDNWCAALFQKREL